jgi:hypothetical protein
MSFDLFLIALFPALVYPLTIMAYFRMLDQKRDEVWRLAQGKTLTRFLKAYRMTDTDKFFRRYYDWKTYLLPVVLNMVIVTVGAIAILIDINVLRDRTASVLNTLDQMRTPVLAGLLGAYIWGIYEMFRRFSTIDLTPVRLYTIWVRFLVAGGLGGILSMTLVTPFDLIVAFGLGVLRVETLAETMTQIVSGKLSLRQKQEPVLSDLRFLQGMTETVVTRLAEEDIESAQHLVLANPFELLMRTSLPWQVILDFIDQAFLYLYVGEKITELRQIGVRCGMELAGIKDYLLVVRSISFLT